MNLSIPQKVLYGGKRLFSLLKSYSNLEKGRKKGSPVTLLQKNNNNTKILIKTNFVLKLILKSGCCASMLNNQIFNFRIYIFFYIYIKSKKQL